MDFEKELKKCENHHLQMACFIGMILATVELKKWDDVQKIVKAYQKLEKEEEMKA